MLLEQSKYILRNVYRALSVIADELDYIQAETYHNPHFLHRRGTKILCYDCTDYYFEIEQESGSKTYDKSRENRPNPVIDMGFFMDTGGFPLTFDLHPGKQSEQKTLKPLGQKVIRDFDCAEFIYCPDSGLGSRNDKLFNDMGDKLYVVTQSLKKLRKEGRTTALDPKQHREPGSEKSVGLGELNGSDPGVYRSIYYKEIPTESKKLSETMIVTYSPKYEVY